MKKFYLVILFLAIRCSLFGQKTFFAKDISKYPILTTIQPKDICKDYFGNYWLLTSTELIRMNAKGTTNYKNKFDLNTQNALFIKSTPKLELIIFYSNNAVQIDLQTNQKSTISFSFNIDSVIQDEKSIYLKSKTIYYDFYTQKQVSKTEIKEPKNIYQASNQYISANDKITDSIEKVYYHSNTTTLQTKKTFYEINETINNRIHYFTSNQLPNSPCRSVFPLNEQTTLLAFDVNNALFAFDGNKYTNLYTLPINSKQNLSNVVIYHIGWLDAQHLLLLEKESKVYSLDITTFEIKPYQKLNDLHISLKNLCNTKDTGICIGSYNGDFVYHHAKKQITKLIKSTAQNQLSDIFRLYEDPNGFIWIGMVKGFAIYNPATDYLYNDFIHEGSGIKTDVSAFAVDNQNRLWIGSYNNNVFFYDYLTILKRLKNEEQSIFKDIKITNFNEAYHFSNTNIKFINTYKNQLFIRTYSGLYILDSKTLRGRFISQNSGFGKPLNNQYNYIVNNQYFSSVPGGFSKINFETTEKNQPTKLFLEDIRFSNKQNTENYLLSHSKEIHVKTSNAFISLKLANYIFLETDEKYEYKIDNGEWLEALDNNVIISTHQSGKQRLQIRSIFPSYFLNENEITHFTIYVSSPWYQTIGFYILLIVFSGGVFYYFYKLVLSEKKNKQKAQQFEMISLRSQMNPHFISNSLNSINLYVLENKSEEASNYIVKFSKLIRSILNHTELEFISLEDEIKMVQNYIEMEKLRFKEKFEYKIEYIGEVNKQYKVPSLVVQPFVENAIWHGLLQNKNSGLLTITIQQTKKSIQIKIEDNGVGRAASHALKSKMTTKRKSFGLEIINKRFELINNQYHLNCSISIHDKETDESGTVVLLNL